MYVFQYMQSIKKRNSDVNFQREGTYIEKKYSVIEIFTTTGTDTHSDFFLTPDKTRTWL